MRPAVLVLVAALLAGCGGGSATATGGTGAASAVAGGATAAPATSARAPTRPKVPFPAKSGENVIALALLRPPGKMSYHVTLGGDQPLEYDLDLASDDRTAVMHQRQQTGELWVAFDVGRQAVQWSCSAPAGGTPECKRGDPDGKAARAAGAVARIFGNAVVQGTFAPVVGGPGTGVGQDTEADLDVSCLASSLDTGDVRLCATKEGFITELTAGPTRVLATSVSGDVTPGDLQPPAQLT
jgi:hypothetical protein